MEAWFCSGTDANFEEKEGDAIARCGLWSGIPHEPVLQILTLEYACLCVTKIPHLTQYPQALEHTIHMLKHYQTGG